MRLPRGKATFSRHRAQQFTPASTRVASTLFSRMPHFPFTWHSFQSNIYTAGQTTVDSQVSSLSTSVNMGCIQVSCHMAGHKYKPLGRWLRLMWKQKMLEIRLSPLNPARIQFTRWDVRRLFSTIQLWKHAPLGLKTCQRHWEILSFGSRTKCYVSYNKYFVYESSVLPLRCLLWESGIL